MELSERVIGHASGSLTADVMFIGEAPGRLGADASAIPFHGDKAGHNFESFLEQVGLNRYELFVTNAVLCNPRDEKGNNATPSNLEVKNCSEHLAAQIRIIDPKFVVTLGAKSLAAIKYIEDHEIVLSEGVRKAFKWNNRTLLPLYHPGQRALIHRNFHNQLSDYQFVKERVSRVQKRRPKSQRSMPSTASSLAAYLLRETDEISYFALHKLFYLVEYEHFKKYGRRVTDSYFIRQKDGPYFTDLHVGKLKSSLKNLAIRNRRDKLYLSFQKMDLFADDQTRLISDDAAEIVQSVLSKYGDSTDTELKRVVYLTSPMKTILKREKNQRENWFNRPISFEALLTA